MQLYHYKIRNFNCKCFFMLRSTLVVKANVYVVVSLSFCLPCLVFKTKTVKHCFQTSPLWVVWTACISEQSWCGVKHKRSMDVGWHWSKNPPRVNLSVSGAAGQALDRHLFFLYPLLPACHIRLLPITLLTSLCPLLFSLFFSFFFFSLASGPLELHLISFCWVN